MIPLILVVDDNPTNLKLACDVLACDGNRVLSAEHAERALAIIQVSKPDLILMDISMPGMDGLALTRKLKADPDTQDIIIVAVTASAMKGDEERVLAAGCDGYIAKPIDTRTFSTQVAGYLKAKQSRCPTILVVDDNATNRKLLRATLEVEGMTVVEASDGVDALEILTKRAIDIIISDLLMPRMDGYRFCFEVRKNERVRTIPIIIYTGTYTEKGDERLALEMGADRYIIKPAPPGAILAAIRELGVQPSSAPLPSFDSNHELLLMKEYNQLLVEKLEERNLDLTRITQELQTAQEKTRHLLKHSPAVLYGLTIDGPNLRPHVVSDNVTELTGFSVEEALSYEWWVQQVHPDDLERALATIVETLQLGSNRAEYRIRHKNGSYRWVEDSRRVIHDSDNTPREIVGVWSDISERKRAEEVLKESERRFREMLENVELIAVTLDKRGTVTFCNEYFLRLTGWAREEVIGGDWFEKFIPVADSEVKRAFFEGMDKGDVPAHYVNPIRTRKGENRQILWNNTMLLDGAGNTIGIASIGDDVTERLHIEEALRESEGRFRQFADNVQEVFWMTNADLSKILYVNAGYERIWMRSAEHLYQHAEDWVDAIVPEDRQRAFDSFAKLSQGEPVTSTEYRIQLPDGSTRWILDRGFAIRDEAGKLEKIAGIAADITERKRLEDGLRRSQKMEAIGQLAGGIAHDFNNILACVLGYTELALMEAAGNESLKLSLEQVLVASHRARDLVRQILTFSRQQEPERKAIKLQPVVKEALQLLRASLPSAIEIHSDVSATVPTVLADATQIHQIILNLATNAAHAMNGRGKLGIALTALEIDAETAEARPELHVGPYAKLSVSDTGAGMDALTLQHLFEPFFTTKAPGEGTGLGLAVVHGIVKSHDGAITVYSELGRGTVFNLFFPADPQSVAATNAPIDTLLHGNGEHILVVDDESALAALSRKILERAGYRVTVHTSAADALAAVTASPNLYDLVITDLTMPNMSGVDLTAELLRVRPDLPIVLVTGFGGAMTAAKAEALGIREVIMKPSTARSLSECVQRVLARTEVP